ncbi:TIM-barrel domain-containing protein [Telmatobacter bradus]|uniref:TIM-barrel domain-containing protein n=1 Tax=Telmatobacter bradus TaxID=474953 RepID=UPI003B430512
MPGTLHREADSVTVTFPAGQLYLQPVSDSVVRVAFSRSAEFFRRRSIDRVEQPVATVPFNVRTLAESFELTTDKLLVRVDRASGAVSFATRDGRKLLAEVPQSRLLEAATVQGEASFHVGQKWLAQPDESLYGLGQTQLGVLDLKGYDLDLWQHNTNVAVPFLVSSRGYGILWDNTSYTHFGDRRSFAPIPAANLRDDAGEPGGLTVSALDESAAPVKSSELALHLQLNQAQTDHPETAAGSWRLHRQCWSGSLVAPVTGDYQFRAYSNGGIQVWFDGKLVMNHWRQNWLASEDQVRVHMEAGHAYPIRMENDPEQQNIFEFTWKTPAPDGNTALWSEVGDGTDYYFVYGPSMDGVIGGYRQLTGKATMLPNWAFGLWQSRQRYETAQQSLDVVREFRRRQIPFDNIVQDWLYWRPDAWGSHQFDATRFPDPDGWVKAIHAEHSHLMLSVWGKFYPSTDNGQAMAAHGYLYTPDLQEKVQDWVHQTYTFYDAFNPGARTLFWSQVNARLFAKGIDAWWMDGTEPDLLPSPPTLDGQRSHMTPVYQGTGARMLNGYALENSRGVYEGQRQTAPDQRVFILTRSGFAGSQRYSTAIWSGDVTSTWTAMEKQIAAGLGASISGLPYWTMDTGGYTMQQKFAYEPQKSAHEEEWRELNARWFEFSTFTPLLRVHGELRPREMWTLGEDSAAYNAELKFDRLRYALQPYIYSLAGWTTQGDFTMLRPLVMDFANDRVARAVADEFMFGPSLLVAPVTSYKQRSRPVYLPEGRRWYDYWTGKTVAVGNITADAPYDRIPVFVPAGAILPYGPSVQYVGEKPADPITLYVYAGADGAFTLYEDQGTNYGYEKGAFATIPLRWNERTGELTIGSRSGSFDGMLEQRTFRVVLVAPGHAAAFAPEQDAARSVSYSGQTVRVKLQ